METLAASEDGSQSKPVGFGIKLLSEGEKYYCPTPRGLPFSEGTKDSGKEKPSQRAEF